MNEKGQTSVEYVLLLSVVVLVSLSVFESVQEYITGDQGIMGKYLNLFQQDLEGGYKTFTLRR